MPMIDTAEVVAKRYGITREAQDEYALPSQQRTAAGQKAGSFDAEIVPMHDQEASSHKDTGESVRGSHAEARTRATAPTPRSRAWPSSSRCAGEKGLHHGGQRQPALRRRLGLRA